MELFVFIDSNIKHPPHPKKCPHASSILQSISSIRYQRTSYVVVTILTLNTAIDTRTLLWGCVQTKATV
jgi:hypothetical protein